MKNNMKSPFISPQRSIAAKWWLLSVTLICYEMLVDAVTH